MNTLQATYLFWLRFRWTLITAVGCAYAFIAPRSFHKRRPK